MTDIQGAGIQGTRQSHTARIREPAVAGVFYSAESDALRNDVDTLLAQVAPRDLHGLRALISPHAGYRYSGAVAASGFKQLVGRNFGRVIVLAPSHRVAFRGVAVPDVEFLRTPLGVIPVSPAARELLRTPPFVLDSRPHEQEHSLEVQLPFLQRTLESFELVPLIYGDVDNAGLATNLNELMDDRTFVIASSDLSHYYPYQRAKVVDEATVQSILRLDIDGIKQGEACGMGPIVTLVRLAKLRGWKAQLLDLRNSGDTAGDRSRVVGYTSIALVDA